MEQELLVNEPLTPEEIEIEEDTSISNQIIDLIRRKYELIENYNNLRSVLLAQNNDALIAILDDIIPAETGIIGILTNMLVETQPAIAPTEPTEVEIIPEI